jgi:hypothetical protein
MAMMALVESVIEALNRGGVRYVVVGGLATVLHGFPRLTADIDLVVDLDPAEARRAIQVLVRLGFRPRPPVDPFDFADPARRAAWIREKGLRVFSMHDPTNPLRELDLFVEHPIDFASLWRRSVLLPLAGTTVRVAAIADLIALKRLAGRPEDLRDIAVLEEIAGRGGTGDGGR